MKLIVDSGSTKTAWRVQLSPVMCFDIFTAGINPVRDDEASMHQVVDEASSRIGSELVLGRASSLASGTTFSHVHFYGAGCLPNFTAPLIRLLEQAFPSAIVEVESDLLGAARALCGREEGIACILGTGANSCLYDGQRIVRQTPALGWILGDEGSGAVLGRRLVGDVLKGQLPQALCEAFLQRFGLMQADIIEHVYRQPQPNRFLASLVPFLAEHTESPAIHAFLVDEFRRFVHRNVVAYGRRDLPVSFVGGVASQFCEELQEAVEAEGFGLGRIEKNPIERMAEYHV